MQFLSVDEVRAWLRDNGVPSTTKIDEVIGGFDFSRAVYLQDFEPGQRLYQYVRRSSFGDVSPMAGNWFCLKGATTSGLAIIDGLSGRRLHKFRVARAFRALEGTAKEQDIQWAWSDGGPGGLTQIYVPSPLCRSSMVATGGEERWDEHA
jgi:hypothetical protein